MAIRFLPLNIFRHYTFFQMRWFLSENPLNKGTIEWFEKKGKKIKKIFEKNCKFDTHT